MPHTTLALSPNCSNSVGLRQEASDRTSARALAGVTAVDTLPRGDKAITSHSGHKQ